MNRLQIALAVLDTLLAAVLVTVIVTGTSLRGGAAPVAAAEPSVPPAPQRAPGDAAPKKPTVLQDPEEAYTTATAAEARPLVERLLADLSAAQSAGDADTMFARLHPAVRDRYGDEACRATVERTLGGFADARLVELGEPRTVHLATPGGTVVLDAYPATVSWVAHGDRTEVTGDFAVVDGDAYWFTTCVTPADTA